MIFSNITVPLLGLVDTAVIGHLDSPVYLGGVAVGATATSFLFMLLLFLRMSTTGLTAQAFGAEKSTGAGAHTGAAANAGAGRGVAYRTVSYADYRCRAAYCRGKSDGTGTSPAFRQIRWLSATASLANLVLLGWLLGSVCACASLSLLIVGNILNIVLGYGW